MPCEKCVSRGCGSICPDGSLASGKGNRLVLANTEELHERIENLSSRIRELETALRALQHTVSDDPHPLLRPELLLVQPPAGPSNTRKTVPNNVSARDQDQNQTVMHSLPTPPGDSPAYLLEGENEKGDDENFIDAFGKCTPLCSISNLVSIIYTYSILLPSVFYAPRSHLLTRRHL